MVYARQYSKEETQIAQRIGRNIRKAREESGLSLDAVAQALRQPKSKLCEIEQGKKVANAILVARLAELFDVSVAYLYSGRDMTVGEELFFDVNKMIAPIKVKMERDFAIYVAKICAAAFPAENQTQKLCDEMQITIERFQRMIQLNEDGAWQDMKGGRAFETQMNKIAANLNEVRKAISLQRRAKKEVGEKMQGDLFQ